MKPILYDADEQQFTSNGLGRLSDCLSCIVIEERNGIYEVEFEYPVTGVHFEDIEEGDIIAVTHDETGDIQPFVIYQRSVEINGVVTFYAHHVSYGLRNVVVAPFSADSIAAAFDGLKTHSLTTNRFTFWTDKTSSGSFSLSVPTAVKAALGGSDNSILSAFGGGEYEWDRYTVKLYQHRGSDSGVTIRYGKNLTDLSQTIDALDTYNAVIPYWTNFEEETVVGGVVYGGGEIQRTSYWTDENGAFMTDENGNRITFTYPVYNVVPMDLSNYFDEKPTPAELEARALSVMNSNQPWIPKQNLKVDFVALWQTEEYKDIAPLERVRLCDTVTVMYEKLGVAATAKVIRTEWNVLLNRYDTIELGDAKSSFAQVLTADTDAKLDDMPTTSMMDGAIQHATSLITGGMGGHVLFRYDANGKPTEILIMDTEDESTAVNVLRINVNGIGFSNTGVDGEYRTAWTLDGQFVADFITAGTLAANMIKGGVLTLGGEGNGNGQMRVLNESGYEIFKVNGYGIYNKTENNGGTEWMRLAESVIMGGFDETMDGTLDFSAQNVIEGARAVVLRALGESILLLIAQDNVWLVSLGGAVVIKSQNPISLRAPQTNLYYNDVLQGLAVASSENGTLPAIKKIYYQTNTNNTRFVTFEPTSGTSYTVQVAAVSDNKFKKNIKDSRENALDTVKKIRHVEFDFKENNVHVKCGYIAQELQKINDAFVVETPGDEPALFVADHEILAYTTKAVQELSAKVEELEARIAKLEGGMK